MEKKYNDTIRNQFTMKNDGSRGDVARTTYTEKADTSLFAEQRELFGDFVLCNGASALMKVWY